MPVIWTENSRAPAETGALLREGTQDAPLCRVRITPNRSLPRRGFAWFLLIIWGLLMLPLLSLLGSMALWIMLSFVLGVLLALWYFIERNYHDGTLSEELTLWPNRIAVKRYSPRHPDQIWEANPYWTTLNIRAEGGPVEQYLTLKGDGREIELGAFLSPDERQDLYSALTRVLAQTKAPPQPQG